MTQNANDVEIANQGFAAFRQDLNDVLEDITTLHSGDTAPTTTYANQWWYETDTDKLYIRNEDNDAWIEILTLDQANDHLATIGASITLDGTGNVSIDSGDFTVDTNTLHVDSTNNRVGIGTTVGTKSLNVNKNDSECVINVTSSDTGTAGIYMGDQSDSIVGGIVYDNNTDTLQLRSSNNQTAVTINSSERVGIGTSNPTQKLTLADNYPYIHFNNASNVTQGSIGYNTGLSAVTVGTETSKPLLFNINSVERIRIDSSGGIRAGTTSAISTESFTFYSSDTIGVAIRNPASGAVRYPMIFVNGSTTVGSITSSASSTSFNTSSDYRLKENVTGITDGIERVKQLSPSRFNFIADADTTVDGFLAHEAQSVVPEAVTGTQDETRSVTNAVLSADGKLLAEDILQADWTAGKLATTDGDGNAVDALYPSDSTWAASHNEPVYQGIDQSKLVPLLTAALQEAITKIETLEAQATDFETRIAALESA